MDHLHLQYKMTVNTSFAGKHFFLNKIIFKKMSVYPMLRRIDNKDDTPDNYTFGIYSNNCEHHVKTSTVLT